MGRPKGIPDKNSHSNGKGPMPAECPSPGTGDCQRLGLGCFGAYQLTSGCAPIGCMRACGRIKRKDGLPCPKWKMKGKNYCYHHRMYNKSKGDLSISKSRIKSVMPSFYSRVLGKTLTKRLEEALEKPPHERTQAYEELALIKDHCANVVQAYSAVVDAHAAEPGRPELFTAVIELGSQMKDACAFVIEQCNKVQQLETNATDKVSIAHLGHLVVQVTRIMYAVCGDDHEDLAIEFERRIKEEVRLPKSTEVNNPTNVINIAVLNDPTSGHSEVLQLARSLGAEGVLEGDVAPGSDAGS